MNNQESYSYQPRSTSSIVIDSTISSRNIFFLNDYRNKDIQMYALTPHTYFNTQYIYFLRGLNGRLTRLVVTSLQIHSSLSLKPSICAYTPYILPLGWLIRLSCNM